MKVGTRKLWYTFNKTGVEIGDTSSKTQLKLIEKIRKKYGNIDNPQNQIYEDLLLLTDTFTPELHKLFNPSQQQSDLIVSPAAQALHDQELVKILEPYHYKTWKNGFKAIYYNGKQLVRGKTLPILASKLKEAVEQKQIPSLEVLEKKRDGVVYK